MDFRKKFQIGDIVARTKEFMAENPEIQNVERAVVGYSLGGSYLIIDTENGSSYRAASSLHVVERNGLRIGERVLVGEHYSCWTQGVIDGFADDGLFNVSIRTGFGRLSCVIVFANPIKYNRALEGKPATGESLSDLLLSGITNADVKVSEVEKIPCAVGVRALSGAAMDKLISDIEKVGGTVSVGEPLTSKWKGDLHSLNGDASVGYRLPGEPFDDSIALTGAEDGIITGKQAYADLVDALAKYNAIAEEVKDAPQFKLVTK